MAKYIGVKVVETVMMSLAEYLHSKGLPFADNDANAAGYRVTYPDGYVSWCPKATFEEANRPTTGMPFGHAIEALRKGLKVARAGWNGKGMWLRIIDPHDNPYFQCTDNNPDADGTPIPWIGMKTADNKFVPWLASQTDILADDWMVVE